MSHGPALTLPCGSVYDKWRVAHYVGTPKSTQTPAVGRRGLQSCGGKSTATPEPGLSGKVWPVSIPAAAQKTSKAGLSFSAVSLERMGRVMTFGDLFSDLLAELIATVIVGIVATCWLAWKGREKWLKVRGRVRGFAEHTWAEWRAFPLRWKVVLIGWMGVSVSTGALENWGAGAPDWLILTFAGYLLYLLLHCLTIEGWRFIRRKRRP